MSSDFCKVSLDDFSNIISPPSQSCDISLNFKDNICLTARQQPASMQSSHTLKRLNHNAEIQMFTPYVSIKDAI